LSPISYHCIFRFYANWVDSFKRMYVELHTYELSKNGSNRKVCTPLPSLGSLKQHCHQSFSSEAMKVANPVSLNQDTHSHKTTQLFHVFTLKKSQKGSNQRLRTLLSRSKRWNTSPWPPSLLQSHLNLKPFTLW